MCSYLINDVYCDPPFDPWSAGKYVADTRASGRDWPSQALTMIGRLRMENLRRLLEDAIDRAIPGDFIETGVWRGGACIFAKAVIVAHDQRKKVWVADSFAGLPEPDDRYQADAEDQHFKFPQLCVSRTEVEQNFKKFDLWDEDVVILEGWFKDTLPAAPIEEICVLRLDGDMYGSTMDALKALYDKISIGGYVIVDDFGSVDGCKRAVEDFRRVRGIDDELMNIDELGVYWQKSKPDGDPSDG